SVHAPFRCRPRVARQEFRRLRPAVGRDAAIAWPQGARTDPHDRAARAQHVEHRRPEVAHARRQEYAAQCRPWQRETLELRQYLLETARPRTLLVEAVPRAQESREGP